MQSWRGRRGFASTYPSGLWDEEKAMDPKDIVRRYYEEVWVKGNVDAIDEFVADDYIDHTPEGDQDQLERLKRVAAVYRDSATDVELDLDILVAEEDRVAAFWTMLWTQRADFCGVPANG